MISSVQNAISVLAPQVAARNVFSSIIKSRQSSIFPTGRRFSFLRREAEIPSDPSAQAEFLRGLNRANKQREVLRHFESANVQFSPGTLAEYMRALFALDKASSSKIWDVFQRGAESVYRGTRASGTLTEQYTAPALRQHYAAAYGSSAAPPAPSLAGVVAGGEALGTTKNPMVMMFAEPSFATQAWRTLRSMVTVFIIITCAGTLLDEKGLSRSSLSSPDLKPQFNSGTKFADVKGVDEAKNELEEIVEYLRAPTKFTSLGGKLPKGVLLVGPPGTGKTMLARAIAGEAGVPFFYCSGSEFEEVYVGVGARRVRDLFAAAKKHAPCIVFIDEIDAIGGNRNPKDQQYMRMTLNQLLVELDGFKASEGVIVVAATNFAEVLDKALVRPGRFDRHIVVPNPDVEGRKQILEVHFAKIPRSPDVDLMTIAKATPGFSGADLSNLINVAALHAAKEGEKEVGMKNLEYARDRILMGAERKSAVMSDKSRKLTAYHEGGHALVALLTEGADPVHKATIVPRGISLGMVMQLPDEDQTSMSRRQILARLDVCMGGRVAEELIFGADDITTGASSDLQQATALARAMVTRYGMSEQVGTVSIEYDETGALSSETRRVVEQEVKRLTAAAYERARALLQAHEADLHVLAQALLEKETLTGDQIRTMLKTTTAAAAAAVATAAGARA